MTVSLDALQNVDPEHLERLHDALVRAAGLDRMLDITYRTVDTPVGLLLLAATAQGIVRVAFESEDHDRVLAELAEHISPRILSTTERLDTAARQLDEYFQGRRPFDLPRAFRLSKGFRLSVLQHLV